MARIIHDTSAILDAAVRLLDSGSVADITMAAVIREAGVSSGSVYHRFSDRGALLGTVWNRAVERFHAGAYPLFDAEPIEAASRLARYTVEWCAANPGDARVLLAGARQFAPDSWPAELGKARGVEQDRWDAHIRTLVRDLRAATGHATTALLLIVVDLPYAAVRRYLASGASVPADLGPLVQAMVTQALASLRDIGDSGALC